MIRKLSLALCLASAAFVGHSQAFAGSASAPAFQAKAHIDPNCTISVAGDLDFGAYDPLQANATAAKTGSTSLTLTCTRGSGSTINLSSSTNFGTGLAGKRAMTNGTSSLSYDLFWPDAVGASAAATATPWGDGTTSGNGLVVAAAPSIAARTVMVFGSIPAGQDASTGVYSDSVVATVNF
ncbi:MAG TPA: spore coat U domain-containing protein [Myxococcales bacterium]|nr:spore coat U domain-containing protein [Myxococcales bacterium]